MMRNVVIERIVLFLIIVSYAALSLFAGYWYVRYESLIRVQVDPNIYQIADIKMKDFENTGVWSHDSSDKTWAQRFTGYRFHGTYFDENLYKGECRFDRAMEAWQVSPIHKPILEKNFKEGIILLKKVDNQCYIILNAVE